MPKRRGIRNAVGTLLFCSQVTWVVTLIFAPSAAEPCLTNIISWFDRLGERAARD